MSDCPACHSDRIKRRIGPRSFAMLLAIGAILYSVQARSRDAALAVLADVFLTGVLFAVFVALVGVLVDKNVCRNCGERWR